MVETLEFLGIVKVRDSFFAKTISPGNTLAAYALLTDEKVKVNGTWEINDDVLYLTTIKEESGEKEDNSPWAIVGREDTMICMTEYRDRKGPHNYDRAPSYQINHFGFRIENKQYWEDQLAKYEIPLKYDGVIEYPKSYSWYINDPTGHEIEVNYSHNKALEFPLSSSK